MKGKIALSGLGGLVGAGAVSAYNSAKDAFITSMEVIGRQYERVYIELIKSGNEKSAGYFKDMYESLNSLYRSLISDDTPVNLPNYPLDSVSNESADIVDKVTKYTNKIWEFMKNIPDSFKGSESTVHGTNSTINGTLHNSLTPQHYGTMDRFRDLYAGLHTDLTNIAVESYHQFHMDKLPTTKEELENIAIGFAVGAVLTLSSYLLLKHKYKKRKRKKTNKESKN